MNRCVVFLLVCVAACSAQQINPCTQQLSWADGAFDRLISSMQASSDRYAYLIKATNDSLLGFSAAQALTLSRQFSFVSKKKQMFQDLSNLWLGMDCDDAVSILGDLTFTSDQLEVLPALVNIVYDLAENNQTIIDFLTFKQPAITIIENAKPFSCIWGVITVPRLIFVVDVSESMSTTFVDPEDGQTYTRLQYVAKDLSEVISRVLAPYQEFNIISFSSGVQQWQQGIVPATQANIKSALNYIGGLSPSGSTNMIAAMKTAFADPDAVAVYLLSDGAPDNSQTQIIQAAQQWSNSNSTQRFVNTVSFQVGGIYDPSAAQFMSNLASVTSGLYRAIF